MRRHIGYRFQGLLAIIEGIGDFALGPWLWERRCRFFTETMRRASRWTHR